MTEDGALFDHLLRAHKKTKARFLRHNGTVYEVERITRPTGPSPHWRIEAVKIVDIEEITWPHEL